MLVTFNSKFARYNLPLKNLFLGVGGKLGTMAFAGVITATLMYALLV
ncbi:hypothetical protein [Winogradskyella psychrotolerans]|nr:hypothetical protein [Winogradskyella psychrotolerans]MBU2928752.1 hypothetical protein [Winogradskyella psychrotolerans]